MILTTAQALILIGVMALCTLLTRALPFLLFPANKATPAYVVYLGKVLPYAIIGMLIVYCLRGVSVSVPSRGLPELIAVGVVTALFLWRRNSLLAVAGGTLLYMFLIQKIFV